MAKFNARGVQTVDQSTVEEEAMAFPFIQYNNGNPQYKTVGGMAYNGGWFIPETNVYEDLSKREGWEKTDWIRDGGDTPGFWSRDIQVAVIASRKRWEVYNRRGPRATFAWNDYDTALEFGRQNNSKPSGRLQVLTLIKGLEDLGALMPTLRGYASMMFEGTNRQPGAMNMFKNIVIAAANAVSRSEGIEARWPRYAFWMPVGPDRDFGKKGEPPVFTKVGGGQATSSVALIKLIGVPDKPQDVNLDDFYVGDEVLKQCEQIALETIEWAEAWDMLGNASVNNTNGSGDDEDTLPEEPVITADELQESEIAF